MPTPVLHLLCGKIASGKSTLARSLKAEHSAVLLSEDHWLSRLYPAQIKSVADYILHAHRIRDVLGPLVIDMLSRHDFAATDAEFDLITSYFRAPDQTEGLDVVIHRI